MSEPDDLAEIDVTEQEFDVMMAEGQAAEQRMWNINALLTGEALVTELFPGENLGSITVDQFAIVQEEYRKRFLKNDDNDD